jgi:hypothetical protein
MAHLIRSPQKLCLKMYNKLNSNLRKGFILVLLYFLFFGCKEKISNYEFNDYQKIVLKVNVLIDDSLVDEKEIDNYFIVAIHRDTTISSIKSINGLISLPLFDSIPDFSVEYKNFKVDFKELMAQVEGEGIFNKDSQHIIMSIDKYPFKKYNLEVFRGRPFNSNNYIIELSNNSNWAFYSFGEINKNVP